MNKITLYTLFLVIICNIGLRASTIDSLLIEFKNTNQDSIKLNLLLQVSSYYYSKTKLDRASEYINRGLDLAKENDDDIYYADFSRLDGLVSWKEGMYDSAFVKLNKALSAYKKNEDAFKIANTLKNLGVVNYSKGNINEATRLFKQVLPYLNKVKNKFLIGEIYGNLGVMYERQSLYDQAIEYNKKALNIFQELGEQLFVGMCQNNIGNLLNAQDQYSQAKLYFEEALTTFLLEENEFQVSKAYINIGITLHHMHQFNKSIEFFKKGIKIKEELKDKQGLALAFERLGLTYYNLNNHDEALHWLIKSESLCKEIGDNYNLVSTLSNLSKVYATIGKYNLGIEKAKEGLILVENIDEYILHANLLNNLSKNNEGMGKYKKALNLFKEAKQFYDSAFSEEKTKIINNILIQFETEKKEQEILSLKQEAIIKNKESTLHKQQKYFAISGAFVLLVLLILTGNRMKLRRNLFEQKEAKLKAEAKYREEEALRKEEELKATAEMNQLKAETVQNELEYRNREITSSALFVAQKNEILSTIDDKLSELKDVIKTDSKKEITKLKHLIKDNIELDDDWNNFKLHFEKVHPKFFETLLKQYPDLTPNEQKICAYLRMNLSGKEIARLMNITPKSTQMSRYRLKKKFDLGIDDDLLEFIFKL